MAVTEVILELAFLNCNHFYFRTQQKNKNDIDLIRIIN